MCLSVACARVRYVWSPVVQTIFFSSQDWKSWAVSAKPVIPEQMPILVDDDLLFEDDRGARSTVVVNRWLRQLPANGCPAPRSWVYYARTLREWMTFLGRHGVELFDERRRLKEALSTYAVHRACGPLDARFEASTWNQNVSILGVFYRWSMVEQYCAAEPFTYSQAVVVFGERRREVRVNLARRRQGKTHVTIKYLDSDFVDLFVNALGGIGVDGAEDSRFRGRELARNSAVGRMVLSTGLRRQEFTYLLACEVPPLPVRVPRLPVQFPVPAAVTKGRKFRTTWIAYDVLAEVHRYLDLERDLVAQDSSWRPPASWGEPLVVTECDPHGGRINGVRTAWSSLVPSERRRLVSADGGSLLVGLRADGGPFTAWPTVFARTADRIRAHSEPRFPRVSPHRLRHSMAMRTMEELVSGYYEQAAKLVVAADDDAALALYLSKSDPLLVLRDLLGHSSVTVTELYLSRLDMTRVYRDAYERAGRAHGLVDEDRSRREADAEFDEGGDL